MTKDKFTTYLVFCHSLSITKRNDKNTKTAKENEEAMTKDKVVKRNDKRQRNENLLKATMTL